MEIKKLEITKSKFDINLKFYFLLKYLVKTNELTVETLEQLVKSKV